MFKTVVKFFIFVFLAIVFSVQLRSDYPGIFWPEIVLALSGLLSFFIPQAVFLLGFALPILPFFEYGALSCFVLAFSFGLFLKKKDAVYDPLFTYLLIVPLLISLIFCLSQEIDPYLLKTILSKAGFPGLFEYTRLQYPVWYRAIFYFSSYVNFILLISVIPKDTLTNTSFVTGLSTSVVFSCLIGLAQLLELHPWFSINREIFWLHVGRYEGTFTDPNALGVMSALLIPYFYYLRANGKLVQIAGIMLACFSVFSESRTFWLAMLSWFIIENINKPKRLAFLFAPLFLLLPKVSQFFQALPFLNRFDRILQTLNWNTFVDSLYSRMLMGEIAFRMWKNKPILGVGLERFYVSQEAVAKASGLDLGDWRDNANNFYLQIASEQGLYGILIFLALIFYISLRAKKQSWRISKVLLIILAIIFVTGPHLFFEEVKYFIAIAIADLLFNGDSPLSQEFKIKNRFLSMGTVPILIGVFLVFVFQAPTRPMLGFWGIENSEDGHVAWTSSKAAMKLCNVPEGASLQFRTFHLPMNLSMIQNTSKSEIQIKDTEWQRVGLSAGKFLDLKLIPSTVWSPAGGSEQGDRRWLGVMVKMPPFLCGIEADL